MKKLLFVFLSIIINFSILPAQSIEGNFELDSLVVEYTIVARDIEQVGNDGNVHTSTYDEEQATYDVTVGWPVAGENSIFDFSLPYWDIGDTMAVTKVPLGSADALQLFGLGLNTDFADGVYTINEGSVYPTTNTDNCVTTQVFLPIQDAGTWTNGGHQPAVLPGNKVKWGWGIITSGVFATFSAPNMVTDALGVNYGAGTDMESWGYIQANYTDNNYSEIDGLNIGWEAHDGVDANLGIISDGDPFFVQAEADLGLMNGMLGRSSLPVDSVTIPTIASLASALGITINVPTENTPFAAGATGIDLDLDGTLDGATTSDFFYVFDPTGDILGGGDGELFSGDEGLMYTGYYATWNTLITLNGITDGVQAAALGGALANPTAPNIPMIVDSVLAYTLWYWDMSEATIAAVEAAGVPAAATAQVGTWLAAGLGLDDVGNALLPYILGNVTGLQAQATLAGTPLTYDNGDPVIVDDSGHDLDTTDFQWENAYYYGELWNNRGGRIFVQSYANCFPAKWTQRVDSHWKNTALISDPIAKVQLIHSSPYLDADISVYPENNLSLAAELNSFNFRDVTPVVDIPFVMKADGSGYEDIFVDVSEDGSPYRRYIYNTLQDGGKYSIMAAGIRDDATHDFDLYASVLHTTAESMDKFALKVIHAVTDAPAIDIRISGGTAPPWDGSAGLLADSLPFGGIVNYAQIPAGVVYTLDIMAHGSTTPIVSYTADLTGAGGGAGIAYASGFLSPSATDSAFALSLVLPDGSTSKFPEVVTASTDVDDIVANVFELKGNYPNPFNPTTKIRFTNDRSSNVSVNVFSLKGEKVITLMNGPANSGTYDVTWDGKNSNGRVVPTGMYLYNVESDGRRLQGKMLFLK